MSANMTTLAGVLKRIQGGEVVAQQNLKHFSYDEIAKSSKKYNVGGAGFFGAINDFGNESVGAISETEQFRTIDNEDYQQYNVQSKIVVAPVEVSGLLSKAADDNEDAFADAVLREVEQAKERCLKDLNRQFFGIGTGKLASPSGIVASTATSMSVDSAQYIRNNMVLDIFSGSTKTVTSIRCNSVDKVNNIVYFNTSLGSVLNATMEVVKEHIRDSAASDGKEMMGLDGIVDDGTSLTTFQGLNATTIREWQAIRVDAGAGNLTSDLLQRLLDDIQTLGGEEADTILMHPKQRRKYLDLVVPEKRFQDGDMDAGYSKLSFNGKQLVLDIDCPVKEIFAIRKPRISRFEVSPMSMGSLDGSDTWLRATNFDKFQAYWRMYGNFGTDKRNSHGKLVNLAVPSGVS